MDNTKTYIVGNWKSNKNSAEIKDWFNNFYKLVNLSGKNVFSSLEVVICPAFVHIPLVKEYIFSYKLPIKIGCQNVSAYENGAYTGEVSANMLTEMVEYVIIGHSERRNYFHEMDEILEKKVRLSNQSNLKVIYCIENEKNKIPKGVSIVAYEPVWAVGTGKTETPENANRICQIIKNRKTVSLTLYGGSVNKNNIKKFLSETNIDGVLSGGASLDSYSFWEIISNATTV